MKRLAKRIIRKYCPNIPALRKKISSFKLKEINKYTMVPKDIANSKDSFYIQQEMVKIYSKQWPEYTLNLNQKLDKYIFTCESVRNRKDIGELRNKVLYACFAYGFMPDEFFAYELEYKSADERLSYISDRERYDLVYHLNDVIDVDFFFDKFKTYDKFKQYYRRDAISVEKSVDFCIFQDFVHKHPVFVKKNVRLSKGDSVELVDIRNCNQTERQYFDGLICQGKYILEEKVNQSRVMSRLNSSSVNTIRCMTFLIGEQIKIGSCFLKVGQRGSFIDNGSKGGILIGIDNQTGILDTFGYDEFLREYRRHPDTGIPFVGYQLPEWEEMCSLVKEMSIQMPTVRYISWDIAHTDDGWVVIEGNGSGQFIGPQIVWKRGFKEDINKLISN